MRKRLWLIVLIGILVSGLLLAVGGLIFYKQRVDVEVSGLKKSYRQGQTVTLKAVVKARTIRPMDILINARVRGAGADKVLQTYFPTVARNQEYAFDFSCLVDSGLLPGSYQFQVRIMRYGRGNEIEEVTDIDRPFTVRNPRKLSARERATRKAKQSGKGLPMDADLLLYAVDQTGSLYGRTIQLAGMFKNITYWDGQFKIVLEVIDPQENKQEFSESFTITSGEQTNFSFDMAILSSMPEGRYAVIARVFDDREGKKGYGRMLNEAVSSFSLVDEKPSINLDGIPLVIPGKADFEFKVGILDDKGVVRTDFLYEVVKQGIIKSINPLKKKKASQRLPMDMQSGAEQDGVWRCVVPMPAQGAKFTFSIEATDTKGQVTKTERYPVSVSKPERKKKEKSNESDLQSLPGFQGYDDSWRYE